MVGCNSPSTNTLFLSISHSLCRTDLVESRLRFLVAKLEEMIGIVGAYVYGQAFSSYGRSYCYYPDHYADEFHNSHVSLSYIVTLQTGMSDWAWGKKCVFLMFWSLWKYDEIMAFFLYQHRLLTEHFRTQLVIPKSLSKYEHILIFRFLYNELNVA